MAIARHFPLNDLTQTAHRIVHAKVASESPAYNAARTHIWTAWALEITETLKDAGPGGADMAAGTVVAHTRGGTVGEVTQVTSGEPRLAVGGEYVLFLWKDEAGYWNIVGQSQGALMVVREEGQPARARNSYRGHRVTYVDGQQLAEKVGPIDHALTDLAAMVRAQVSAGNGTVQAPPNAAGPASAPAAVPLPPPLQQEPPASPASSTSNPAGASMAPPTVPSPTGRAE